MRISSRGIIIQNNQILTMFRRKIIDGKVKEYYVIPGGGVEKGETLEDTVKRELKEEMNVDIQILSYIGKWEDDGNQFNFFECQIIDGFPHLGGEELEKNSEQNYYEPRFIDLLEIDDIDLVGKKVIKDFIQNKKAID